MIRWRSRPHPMPTQPTDRERRLQFHRVQLALSERSATLRDQHYDREITSEDGWDYYADEGDRVRIAELREEIAWLEVDPLDRLEASVERACQAIYAEREGYWPSDSERHNIAIALVAALADFDPPRLMEEAP